MTSPRYFFPSILRNRGRPAQLEYAIGDSELATHLTSGYSETSPSNTSANDSYALNTRYIPGVGRMKKSTEFRGEKYVGALDFKKMDETLKHRASIHKDGVPSIQHCGAFTYRDLGRSNIHEISSWDSLAVLEKDMQRKPLPLAVRCSLFGARIASRRRLFDGAPGSEATSLTASNCA